MALAGAAVVREIVSGRDGGSDRADLRIERTGSIRLDGERPDLSHADRPPPTWRIQYRIANPGTVTSETVTVRAPFESHTEVRAGGRVSEVRETALGMSVAQPAEGVRVGLAARPDVAGLRTGPAIADAAATGLVERREQRRVAGLVCQVYRSAGDLGGTTFVPATSPNDFVDVCVDDHGLVLELVEYYRGRIIRQRVAIDVELAATVTDEDVAQVPRGQTIAAAQGGGSFRPVAATSVPVGPFFVLDAPPDGFTPAGRYEVIPPQPDITNPDTRGRVVAATSDVYVNGADAVIVERGARLDTDVPWELDERFPDVDLGGELGTGEFLCGVSGGEIRVRLPGGRFVRVYGTVRQDELVAVARALRLTDGGTGPDYLDD